MSANHHATAADRALAEHLALLHQNWSRTPYAVAVALAMIAALVWPFAGWAAVSFWVAIVVTALAVRQITVILLNRRGMLARTPRRAVPPLAAITFVCGCCTGSSAYLLLPAVPGHEQSMVTMILCCWGAAAVVANGGYPLMYRMFALGLYPPLAVFWLSLGTLAGAYVALLIATLAIMTITLARDVGTLSARWIAIALQNEQLVESRTAAMRAAEAARVAAEEANRAKSRFLAAASHDLRQPLQALSMLSDTLTDAPADAARPVIVRDIQRAVRSLNVLFSDLLELSRLDAGVLVPERVATRLDTLLDQLASEFRRVAERKELAFELIANAPGLVLDTDPVLLERILRNLLDNAIRYTDRGFVRLEVGLRAGDLVVAVSDSGIGIPQEELPHVFREFYQADKASRRHGGLGLGLAIVHRISELLHYRIELESASGAGSRFSVVIPKAQIALQKLTPEAEAAPSGPRSHLQGTRMLVLDDDEGVLGAMLVALEHRGAHALGARSLEAALGLLRAQAEPPQVLVVDFRLEGERDGLEAVRTLRDEVGAVPALIVTADTSPALLARFADAGLPVLHKPVQFDVLAATIHDLVSPPGLEAARS